MHSNVDMDVNHLAETQVAFKRDNLLPRLSFIFCKRGKIIKNQYIINAAMDIKDDSCLISHNNVRCNTWFYRLKRNVCHNNTRKLSLIMKKVVNPLNACC